MFYPLDAFLRNTSVEVESSARSDICCILHPSYSSFSCYVVRRTENREFLFVSVLKLRSREKKKQSNEIKEDKNNSSLSEGANVKKEKLLMTSGHKCGDTVKARGSKKSKSRRDRFVVEKNHTEFILNRKHEGMSSFGNGREC